MQLTAGLIRKLCPDALSQYVLSFSSAEANALYVRWGLDEPLTMAAFMAMISHETGGMTIVRESTHYTTKARIKAVWPSRPEAQKFVNNPIGLANCVYNGRMGNRMRTGDGFNFRGCGPLQATGRSMFEWLEKETELPIASNPDFFEDHPSHWPFIAITTWCKQGYGNLNLFAEQGNFDACCRAINTGSPFSKITVVGMADRRKWYERWCVALTVGKVAAGPQSEIAVYRYGSPKSVNVENIQKRLNTLRYAEGIITTDGVFGTRTRSAVMDFQLENGLTADGAVGPLTWDKLFSDAARPFPAPAAVALGVAGLRAAGDPDIQAADNDRASAVLLATGGGLKLADSSGLLDSLGGAASALGTGQSAISTVVGAAKFGAENILPVFCVIAALLAWRRYGAVVWHKIDKWTKPIEVSE